MNILSKDIKKTLLKKMMLIREFENVVSDNKMQRKIYGSAHCYNGEEAIAAGICGALNKDDYIISNHRPHGHAIAKGVPVNQIMAEIFGKSTGTNGGKGGSMHVNDKEFGMITATGIVGSGLPVSLGSAFASKYKKDKKITVVFFGDGSANEGVLHECLNLASVWKLPLLFVLEHNGLAITVQTKETSAIKDYTKLAQVYGIQTSRVDGQNVEEVYNAAVSAISLVRTGEPFFIQADTFRFHEHAEGEYYFRMRDTNYRDNAELEQNIKEKCPIGLYSKELMNRGELSEKEFAELNEKVKKEIEQSLEFALNSPLPDSKSAFKNVFSEAI